MTALAWDLRISLRSLLRRPLFTLFAATLLALGIGASTAVFVLLDAMFRHPLAVPHLEQSLAIYRTTRTASGEYAGFEAVSHPDYRDLQERSRSFSSLALYQALPLSLVAGGEAERTRATFVTANYFDLLGLLPERGRFFQPGEDRAESRSAVAVLGHSGWQRLFGADPGVLGRTIVLNGRGFQIVGVAPEGFKGTDLTLAADVWLPLSMFGEVSTYGELVAKRGYGLFYCLGRLKPGVSAGTARAELDSVARRLAAEFPDTDGEKGLTALPLAAAALNAKERPRYVSFGRTLYICFGLVMLVICSSVGTLLLIRGFEASRELAVRQALGAGRWQALRPLLYQSLLLFALGGIVSLPMARWTADLLWRLRPPELAQARLDLRLGALGIGFAWLLVAATCLLFAVLPAVQALRPDPFSLFRTSSAVGGPRRPWRRLSVAGQVALALLSLIGAALFLRSLDLAREVDLGFEPSRLAVVTVAPGDQGYDAERGQIYYQSLLARIQALPGVRGAALSENRLLRGAVIRNEVFRDGEDHGVTSAEGSTHRVNVLGPGFFRTVAMPLQAGRDFAVSDCATCPPVAIVNQTMADLVWPGESAIGKRIRLVGADAPPVEIVGVAANARYRNVFEGPLFFIYLPLAQVYKPAMTLHVRTAGAPEDLLPAILRQAKAIDPRLPLADAGTMESYVDNALWLERTSALLLSVLGALALALAVLGVYAGVAYSVARRAREMGIRLTLGATRWRLQWMVLRETLAVIGWGVLTGWALAYFGLSKLVAGQLHGVDPAAPAIYAGLALVLFAVGLLGGLLSSRRTLKIEPALTLTTE